MPEGPSIVILKEEVKFLKGKEILHASGNSKKIDISLLKGKTIRGFKSWGKHFLILFDDFTIRIHFMLFGSYRINERRESKPRLSFQMKDAELNFYACSVKLITEKLNDVYDWSADVMNKKWDSKKAKEKLKKTGKDMVCDALLNQSIFSGVGNIIKNEVLYRIHVHPATRVSDLPARKVNELVKEAVQYSFDFLAWKKKYTLRKHWLAHTKTICLRCNLPILKTYMGKTNRRTFFCENCQRLYGSIP